MISRTASTLALWALVAGLLYFLGVHGALLLLAVGGVLAQLEIYQLLERIGYTPRTFLGLCLGAVTLAGTFYLALATGSALAGLLAPALALVTALAVQIRGGDDPEPTHTAMATLYGLVVVPFLFVFYVLLISLAVLAGEPVRGLLLLLWVVAVVKFADVGAYLTGRWLGKTPLAPRLSPGKTWEGLGGGVLLAVLVGLTLSYAFPEVFDAAAGHLQIVVGAMVLALISAVSDLMESSLKRQARVKDSGRMIPGIGGVLDLVDSLLLTAPVAYFLFAPQLWSQ